MRTFPILALCGVAWGLSGGASAETTYLGLYMQGSKIGYSSYASMPERLNGNATTRTDSSTVMDTGLLGTTMKIEMTSTTWTTTKGAPIRMKFTMSSGGRTQKVDAVFGNGKVVATVDNSGHKSSKTLPIPGGTVVDDPLTLVVNGGMKVGATKSLYVLDPMTVSFIKNDVRLIGKAQADVHGKKVDSTLVEIADPRATMRVYLTGKGDLVRADGPMGIEMYPVTKVVALGKSSKYTPSVDLAFSTSLKTDIPIEDPAHVTGLKLRIIGRNLSQLPTGEYQTVSKDGDAWVVDVHPPQISADKGGSISAARAQKPEWAKPSMNLPSNTGRFLALAKKVVGTNQDVQPAAFAIREYVHSIMSPNAGIGVLRDANEVLDSKEGVCRDYAVLTTTLLRAAGIPARLASGIVNWDGTFYYHAWAEAWDGHHWIGIDSTSDDNQISAAHVKLGEGSVEQAFAFTFLDKAKIEVLEAKRG